MPIFLAFTLLGIVGVALSFAFSNAIAEKQQDFEEAYARMIVRLQRTSPRLADFVQSISANSIGRSFICVYFINEATTVVQTNPRFASLLLPFLSLDGVWQEHRMWVDASNVAGGVAAVLCSLYIKPLTAAVLMLADIIV